MSGSHIQQTGPDCYVMKRGGHDMTLRRTSAGWEMTVVNAAVRAHNNGVAFPKVFKNLREVESRYKLWSGISKLLEEK